MYRFLDAAEAAIIFVVEEITNIGLAVKDFSHCFFFVSTVSGNGLRKWYFNFISS